MSLSGVLSFLGLMLAAAAAQDPQPCVSPPLMNGQATVMAANGGMVSTASISYDAYGQRMRVKTYFMSTNATNVDQLMLFKQKIYYEINWSKLSCKKIALDCSFVPFQVPSDAKLMGQVIMGSSSSWGMGVLVNTWHGLLPNNGYYSTVFTETGCIPMVYNVYIPSSGWTTVSTYNWVLGITNPMDFNLPFICRSAKLEEAEEPHTVFTALESLAMNSVSEE